MNKNSLSIVILTVVAIFLLGYKSNKYCRSHGSFLFHCHHDDSNTDIYLRRLDVKLDKIIEQIDSTSEEMQTKNKIDEDAAESKMIILCMLEQLRILERGNLHTGFLAAIMPDFLRNDDDKLFDHQTDALVALFTELKNYTKEEAELFRGTLLERTSSLELIKRWIPSMIESNLSALIKQEVARAIISEHGGFRMLQNLQFLVSERYDLVNKDLSKREAVMKTISDGKVLDEYDLKAIIRKVYFGKAG